VADSRIRVGMPASLWLDEFGSQVWHAFGEPPYLVGSALANQMTDAPDTQRRQWFDVDVRVILDDDVYAREGYGEPDHAHRNGKWVAMCLAFSELGRRLTGLPIDFQIQQRTAANKDKGPRSALGMVSLRFLDEASPRRGPA
jgi:hypothetical protein